MTRLTPEAEAFSALMDKERDDWPAELRAAAITLRCELDAMRFRNWDAHGIGPRKLKEYTDAFEREYAKWRRDSDNESGRQR